MDQLVLATTGGMSLSYNVQPTLDNETIFDNWKRDISYWLVGWLYGQQCKLTELPPDKRAFAIYLSLTEKDKEITSAIKIEHLKHKDGVQALLKRLDNLLNTQIYYHQPIAVPNPIVYLVLKAAGKSLGRVRIQLTCGPRRRDQMLKLCSARGGNTWGGSHFDEARDISQAGETLRCQGYMTPAGERFDTAIVPDLEGDECEMYVSGAVTQEKGNEAGFIICTRTDPLYTDRLPELGCVVEGLDLLCKAMGQLTTKSLLGYDASDIRIVYAGVHSTG